MDEARFEVVAVDTRRWGEKGGDYSDDRSYRWSYTRPIGDGSTICWIGLNPGTGDSEGRYRPTLQRMVDRSVAMGMGRFILVNLFGWRSTKPADLKTAARQGIDVVGQECDSAIADAASRSDLVVAAWGVHGKLLGRGNAVRALVPDLHCLGLTKKGSPRHPLYVPATQPVIPWIDRE